MSISTELTRLQSAKATLQSKGVELGIALSTDQLDAIATKFDQSLTDRGAIAGTLDGLTTTTYTVAAGYHDGSGTVTLSDAIENALAAL